MSLRKTNQLILALALIVILPSIVLALPEGEEVAAGQATFDRTSTPGTLNITTPSDQLIINYNSFSIAQQETVNFIQPSSNSVALNRVVGIDPSSIFGTLTATGRIFIVNPNGVIFGPNSRVDAPALIASTLDISNQDFLNGNYNFFKNGGNAFIINQGNITIRNGGYVCLLSQAIRNEGAIQAQLGTVVLASGEKMTLALDDLNEISVVVDEAVRQVVPGFDSAIKNDGTISANGGKVILTAKVLNQVFDYAINNTGVIEAKNIVTHDGVVELVAEGAPIYNIGKIEAGIVTVSSDSEFVNIGQIISNGSQELPNGGSISIQAATILQQGLISANAVEGGTAGDVSIVSETSTTLDSGSTTEAKALGVIIGNGGRVSISGNNVFVNNNAKIDVSAGTNQGNAGMVFVSAFDQLGFYGVLNGRAPPGYLAANVTLKTDLPYDSSLLDVTSLFYSGIISAQNISIFSNQRVLIDGILIALDTISVDVQGATLSGTFIATQGIFNMNLGDTYLSGDWGGSYIYFDTGNIYVVGDYYSSGDLYLEADSDNNGSGDFLQVDGTTITGGANITLIGANVYIAEAYFGADPTHYFYALAKTGEIKVGWYSYDFTDGDTPYVGTVGDGRITSGSGIGTFSVYVAEDSYTDEGQPANNYGADTTLNVAGGNLSDRWTWLKFDLSGIPDGAVIINADLYVYVQTVPGSLESSATGAYHSDGTWSEGAIIWSNQPASNSSPTDVVDPLVDKSYNIWNVTGDVQSDLGDDSSTWVLKQYLHDESSNVLIWSQEHSPSNLNDEAKLVGTYLTALGSGNITLIANGDSISKNDITLGQLITNGDVFLNSVQGAIIDANGLTNNVFANDLSATALYGIGLDTNIDTLTAYSADTGNIIIDETDGIILTSVLNAVGAVDITAGGEITAVSVATTNGTDTDDVSLETLSGDILVDSVSALGLGDVTLTSAGAIEETSDVDVDLQADNLDLNAQNGIGATNTLETSANTISADTTSGKIDIDNYHGTVDTTATSLTTGSGDIYFSQFGSSSSLEVITATTGGSDINIDVKGGGDLTAGYIEAGGTGDVTLTTIGGGNVYVGNVVALDDLITVSSSGLIDEKTPYDGSADLTAAILDLDAVSGIGTVLSAIETSATTISADNSGSGNINLVNTNAADATAASLTTGTGSIYFSQTGGGALQVNNATTGNGDINLDVTGNDLTVVIATAGGSGDINLTTYTSGDIYVGEVKALLNQITINSAGKIDEYGDDPDADLLAFILELNAVSGIFGSAIETEATLINASSVNGDIDIDNYNNATTTTTTSTGTGNILFTQTGNGALIVLSASTGNGNIGIDVWGNHLIIHDITAGTLGNIVDLVTYTGSIIDGNDATGPPYVANNNVTADTLHMSAVTGIGVGSSNPIETQVSNISADTTNGNIEIDNTNLSETTATSLTTGTGNIIFNQFGGGDLLVEYAQTTTGDIDITVNNGGDLSIGNSSIIAGTIIVDDGDVYLTTIDGGDIYVGYVEALNDTITIDSSGAIEEYGDDPGADLVAAILDLDAVDGIGNLGAIETSATSIDADTTAGDINLSNYNSEDTTIDSFTTGEGDIIFAQSGGGDLYVNSIVTDDGNIDITVDGAEGDCADAYITYLSATDSASTPTSGAAIFVDVVRGILYIIEGEILATQENLLGDASIYLAAEQIGVQSGSIINAIVDFNGTAEINLTTHDNYPCGNGNIDITDSEIEAIVNDIIITNTATITLDASGSIIIAGPELSETIQAIVYGDGIAEVSMSAGTDIIITDETVLALVTGDGEASIGMETYDGITITNDEIIANVVGEGQAHVNLDATNLIDINSSLVLALLGTGFDTAEVNMSASTIEITDSEVGAVVDGDGTAEVNLTAEDGNIVITDSLLGAIVSGEGEAHVNLNASNLIDIDGSWIFASIGWGFLTAEVNMSASAIEITDSEVDALVDGNGSATIDMDARDGDISITDSSILADVNGWGHAEVNLYADDGSINIISDLLDSDGLTSSVRAESNYGWDSSLVYMEAYGAIEITDSLIEALVNYEGTSYIQLYAYEDDVDSNIIITRSIVNAEVVGYSHAEVDLYADDGIIITDSDITAYSGGSNLSSIVDMEADYITIQDSSVEAVVNGNSFATVEMDAWDGDISITDSSILADVNGYGHAEVNLYADNNISITNSDVTAYSGESDETSRVDLEADSIDIEDSTLEAIVYGDGSAYVEMDAYDGDITITDSTVLADVNGYGHAEVDMTAWDGSIIITGTPDAEEPTCTVRAEIDYDDDTAVVNLTAYGSIDITDSSIEAIVNDYGNAYINLYAYGDAYDEYSGNININHSNILADVDGYGSAYVNMQTTGSYYYYYYYGGAINILDNSIILASVGSGTDTAGIEMYSGDISITDSLVQAISTDPYEYGYSYVNLYAYGNYDWYNGYYYPGTITVDNSSLLAEVAGYGSAYINLQTYGYPYYYSYGGSIDILNNSTILASVARSEYDSAGIQMYSGDINIEDSTVQAISTDPYEYGYSYINLYAYGNYDWYNGYYYPGSITIDNSSLLAEVAGYGSAYINLQTYGYYYYYDGTIDIINDSLVSAHTGGGSDSAGIYMYSGDINIQDSRVEAVEDLYEEWWGNAYINLYAYYGDITITDSHILADVNGNGHAEVNLYAYSGSINIIGTQGEDGPTCTVRAEIDYDNNDDDDTAQIYLQAYYGSINISDSLVEALVNGYGNAYVYMYVYGYYSDDSNINVSDSTISANVLEWGYANINLNTYTYYGYENSGNINIDNSDILAEVVEEGSAYVNIQTNNYEGYYYSVNNNNINISNNSLVHASVAGNEYTAGIYMSARNIYISDSLIEALTTNPELWGSAYVNLYAYSYSYDYYTPEFFENAGNIIISNSSIIADVAGWGDASIYMSAYRNGYYSLEGEFDGGWYYEYGYIYGGGNINITNSLVLAEIAYGDDTARVDLNSGDITVTNSSVIARVLGDGSAYVSMRANGNSGWYSKYYYYNDYEGDGEGDQEGDYGYEYVEFSNGGNINIIDSNILAQVIGYGHAQVDLDTLGISGEEDGFGFIYDLPYLIDALIDGKGAINIINSLVRAESGSSPETAYVGIYAGDINVEGSAISAQVIGDYGISLIILLATNNINIDAPSTINASTDDGLSLILLLAGDDINALGGISASGGAGNDIISLLEGLISIFYGEDVVIGAQYSYSSAVIIGTLTGDITLGDVSADAVIVAALGLDELIGSSIYDAGDVTAHYLGLLARNDIGTSEAPINTDVDILSAYSFDTGNIYINEANNIELGLYLPLFGFVDGEGEYDGGEELEQVGAVGASVAANNGIIHIVSGGDMLVNSVVAPNGGVFLESTGGSIYAGRGWCPAFFVQEEGDGFEEGFLFFDGFFGFIDEESFLMDGWSEFGGPDGFWALKIDEPDLPAGPNVFAGSYSYFAAPVGTIGVGTPEDISVYNPLQVNIQVINLDQPAVPEGFTPLAGLTLLIGGSSASGFTINTGDGNGPLGVSGAIMGIVRPGVIPITLAYLDPVAPDLDQTSLSPSLFPPGYVFYDDTDAICSSVLIPYSDLPATNEVPAEDYASTNQIWPPAPAAPVLGIVPFETLPRFITPYLEQLQPYQLSPFINVTGFANLGLVYFYHPITPTDSSAFADLTLEVGAYEFIQDYINIKGHQTIMPILDELKNRKKRTL